MFCYQQDFFHETREVDRDRFWALVRAPYTKELIDGIREHRRMAAACLEAGDGDAAKEHNRKADALKKKLPAFVFQATFDETTSKSGKKGRWRKQAATRLTGIAVMDIDHVDGSLKEIWLEAYAKLSDEDKGRILLVYITPSGHGLKIVFKADAARGNLIDNQHYMARVLGLKIDESCKDASRLSFICKESDILMINENELFTYENKAFAEKYDGQYRGGSSQPTLFPDDGAAAAGHHAADQADSGDGQGGQVEHTEDELPCYHGASYMEIIEAWLDYKQPEQGDRHKTSLVLADQLRYITDNDPKLIERILREVPFVRAIVDERGENVGQTVKAAMDFKHYKGLPKRMREALEKAGVGQDDGTDGSQEKAAEGSGVELPLTDWGNRIGEMMADYPLLSEVCHALPVESRPAAVFVGAALLGTLMTRCWYHFYHRPEEERRLNYCVIVIGDPASGKSFATKLYKVLATPIKAKDQVGYDAINRYKRERQERTTSSKAQKSEALKKPDVIIRDHPSRTSNATFITDMLAAVETVEGRPMHLHMLTFDSELDNATLTQRGGSWIDKSTMELKAFHNEEDGQAYSNLDSVSGEFNVFWNYIYTGTPLSLDRKVSEKNFGSGLATRLAVIPLPPSGFRMMELSKASKVDFAVEERMKEWAFKLEELHGELPLWPLVEEGWHWCADRMEIAGFNQDKAEEMLLKRVPYYGINIATPFVVMRHFKEWTEKGTLSIDDRDRELARLVMDIQYTCQLHFFGAYAQAYFDNMNNRATTNKRHYTKYQQCYRQLPEVFTVDDVCRTFAVSQKTAYKIMNRFVHEGITKEVPKENGSKKVFKKVKMSLV